MLSTALEGVQWLTPCSPLAPARERWLEVTALVSVTVLGSRLGDNGGRSGAEYSVGREDLGAC